MIVGCYSLDLYCEKAAAGVHSHHPHHVSGSPAQFTGETGGECRAQARKKGWHLDLANGRAICHKCWANGVRFDDILKS